jgi:hypothetical protein
VPSSGGRASGSSSRSGSAGTGNSGGNNSGGGKSNVNPQAQPQVMTRRSSRLLSGTGASLGGAGKVSVKVCFPFFCCEFI